MFILGSESAIHAGPHVQSLIKNGRRTSWWHYKVNSYKLVRGVYPSIGFILLTRKSLTALGVTDTSEAGPFALEIAPELTLGNVIVVKATAINPGKSPSDSTPYVVELSDTRRHLEETILFEDFNVIDRHDNTQLHYRQDTIKSSQTSSKQPYTWEQLIDYLWEKPEEEVGSLIHDSALYPAELPCNYYAQGISCADLLNMVLNDLGLTIYYDKDDGNFYIRGLDTDDSVVRGLLTGNGQDTPNYLSKLYEVRHQEFGNVADIPGKLKFLFPARNYKPTITEVSADQQFQTEPFYIVNNAITESPYTYANVNTEDEHSFMLNPVAYYPPNGNADPVNKSRLFSFIETVRPRYIRKMASMYGPILTIDGLVPLTPGRSIAAVTWFTNVTAKGNTVPPKTTVEVPDVAAYSHRSSSRKTFVYPDYPGNTYSHFPQHRSIVIKPVQHISKDTVGNAQVISYDIATDGSVSTNVLGQIPILNISGATLRSDKNYTSDFHWGLQQWAVWPGASSGDPNTPNQEDGTPVRFKLYQDFERGQGYAEAHLIDIANNPVDTNGDPIEDLGAIANWQANQLIPPGELAKATVADVGGRWAVGEIIIHVADDLRTTNPIFNTQEMQFWEKYDQPSGSIVVVDQEGKRYGYTSFTDPLYGEQDGYIGTAYRIPGDVGDDYAGTGFPGYQILDMEAEARTVEGTISQKINETSFILIPSAYWGASPNNRPPRTSSIEGEGSGSSQAGLIIFCRLDEKIPEVGKKVRVDYDDFAGQYVLTDYKPESEPSQPVSGNDTLIGKLVTDLTITTGAVNVTVTDYTGANPGATVSVSNLLDPLRFPANSNDRLFHGNAGGYCTAVKYPTIGWVLTSVQVPRKLPV